MKMENSDYLQLSGNPLRFEAVNQLTNVFFDDSNKEVGTHKKGYTFIIDMLGSRYLQYVLEVLWELW